MFSNAAVRSSSHARYEFLVPKNAAVYMGKEREEMISNECLAVYYCVQTALTDAHVEHVHL